MGRSVARFLNSSARTSVHPQTHEPGEEKQDGGLNTRGGISAEKGKQNVE